MRPVLSDDPVLAEVRFRLYLHQATAHGYTPGCDICVSIYAEEEARVSLLDPWEDAA